VKPGTREVRNVRIWPLGQSWPFVLKRRRKAKRERYPNIGGEGWGYLIAKQGKDLLWWG
tara:strand:+ start:275 stop:451 length:177 start_codon:yes stop_codon:yes gene_type:complete